MIEVGGKGLFVAVAALIVAFVVLVIATRPLRRNPRPQSQRPWRDWSELSKGEMTWWCVYGGLMTGLVLIAIISGLR